MCNYDNIGQEKMQVLDDSYTSAKNGERKARPWRAKKMQNELLAIAYDEVDEAKASRLRACATVLSFKEYNDGTKKLDSMNSCRVRLCPICSWRRSLKNFYNNLRVAEWLEQNEPGEWLHLTLTIRNCSGDELGDTIDKMMYSFNKFTKNVNVKKVVRGYYRGLEVTHDVNEFITRESYDRRKKYLKAQGFKVGDKNPTFDLYHPHFHVLLNVSKSYFKSRDYMSLEAWGEAWQQALGVAYMPSIKVQRLKAYGKSAPDQAQPGESISESLERQSRQALLSAVAEVSKYATKSGDYIYPDDWDLTVSAVRILDAALSSRRLIAYGGNCLKAQRALKLDDADSGDLVNVGDELDGKDLPYEIVSYAWNTGYKQYGKVKN